MSHIMLEMVRSVLKILCNHCSLESVGRAVAANDEVMIDHIVKCVRLLGSSAIAAVRNDAVVLTVVDGDVKWPLMMNKAICFPPCLPCFDDLSSKTVASVCVFATFESNISLFMVMQLHQVRRALSKLLERRRDPLALRVESVQLLQKEGIMSLLENIENAEVLWTAFSTDFFLRVAQYQGSTSLEIRVLQHAITLIAPHHRPRAGQSGDALGLYIAFVQNRALLATLRALLSRNLSCGSDADANEQAGLLVACRSLEDFLRVLHNESYSRLWKLFQRVIQHPAESDESIAALKLMEREFESFFNTHKCSRASYLAHVNDPALLTQLDVCLTIHLYLKHVACPDVVDDAQVTRILHLAHDCITEFLNEPSSVCSSLYYVQVELKLYMFLPYSRCQRCSSCIRRCPRPLLVSTQNVTWRCCKKS